MYSNIHAALEQLLTSIDRKRASGIFIFTDGILEQGDYDVSTEMLKENGKLNEVKEYRRYLVDLIAKVKLLTGKPVFLIQTSNKPVNAYYAGLEEQAKKSLKDSVSLINSNTVFWLKDTEIYDPEDINSVNNKAFVDFVARANDMIIRSEPEIGVSNDSKIDKSVLLNDVVVLNDFVKKSGLKPNLGKQLNVIQDLLDSAVITSPAALDSLHKHKEKWVSAVQIEEIKNYINKITVAELQQILQTLQKKVADSVPINKIANVNLLNISSSNKVFTSAKLTATTLVSQAKGIKSAEKDIILGVADYVIERAKQEAVYVLMERLNDKVLLKNKALQSIFPELTETLKDANNYHDLNLLKEILKRDLVTLPDNIVHSEIYKNQQSLTAMVAMIKLFKNINENQSVELAFKQLVNDLDDLNVPDQELVYSLKFTANVIGYLTTNDLASVYNDKPKLEKLSKLIVALSLDEATLTKINAIDLDNAASVIREIYLQYKLISAQIAEFNKEIKPSADFDGYRRMRDEAVTDILSRSSDLLFSGNKLLNYLKIKDSLTKDSKVLDAKGIKELIRNVNKVKEAYFFFRTKEYTQAAVLMAPELMKAVALKAKAMDSNYVIDARYKELSDKVLYIAAEVSEAQTAEAVKKVLAKYALPVASYRIKHNTSPNLMLSAYLGAGAAYFSKTDTVDGGWRPVLSAPIGLDYSFKLREGGTTFSLFASVLDIGNVISKRLWNRNNANDDDLISLKHIVSPGIFLTVSPNKKLPLSLNFGYAFNPGRLSASLNFDMPLFALYRNR
ncbi:MAG: hypothetical protein EOO92_15930 [Pedobacter sp.]|nr:MAG: hypothetical protein EOO92_15930 [Pedobacter sp.]